MIETQENKDQIIAELLIQNQLQQAQILKLQNELLQIKRMVFGKKSERFVSAPSEQLILEGLIQEEPVVEKVSSSQIAPSEKVKQKPVRKAISDSVSKVVEEIQPDGVDLSQYKFIGVEESSRLEMIEAKVINHITRRYKYVHKSSGAIIISDLPYRPFAKHLAGASVIAQIAVDKFNDGLPLHRQQKRFERAGVDVSYSTLCDWNKAGAEILRPLYEVQKKEILSSKYLMADESPYEVHNETKNKLHRGFHWVYYDPLAKNVFFNYQPGRGTEGPKEILKNYKGFLQTDGYQVYDQFERNPDITLMNCMAHARRYFEQALNDNKSKAEYFLSRIQELYAVEKIIRENDFSDEEILSFRKEKSVPILLELKTWLDGEINTIQPKTPYGKAVAYSWQRWEKLSVYAHHAQLKIDNNPVENSIRPMVIARKNCLFAGSHDAADRSAIYFTFIITCRLHNINPYQWLLDVYNRIESTKPSQLPELLPHRWKIA